MPWRECCRMDERLKFLARLLEGEKMAVLCPGVRYLAQDRLTRSSSSSASLSGKRSSQCIRAAGDGAGATSVLKCPSRVGKYYRFKAILNPTSKLPGPARPSSVATIELERISNTS